MKLLEIAEEIRTLENLLASASDVDGELEHSQAQILDLWFDEIKGAEHAKLDGYCALIREAELRRAARNEECERLAMLAKSDDSLAKRLKDRLKLYLEQTGQKAIETARYKISHCANGGALPITIDTTAERLPAEYVRTKLEPNAERIREALTLGVQVPGCYLGERGTHVRIR